MIEKSMLTSFLLPGIFTGDPLVSITPKTKGFECLKNTFQEIANHFKSFWTLPMQFTINFVWAENDHELVWS